MTLRVPSTATLLLQPLFWAYCLGRELSCCAAQAEQHSGFASSAASSPGVSDHPKMQSRTTAALRAPPTTSLLHSTSTHLSLHPNPAIFPAPGAHLRFQIGTVVRIPTQARHFASAHLAGAASCPLLCTGLHLSALVGCVLSCRLDSCKR